MKLLYESQADAQRAISRTISAYPLHTSGVVSAHKFPALVKKFCEEYEVDISPAARQHRKRTKRCSTRLIAAEIPGEKIRFVLLVTEHGSGTVKEKEMLVSARKKRLRWGDYVLMYKTRTRRHGGGSRWTWCMTKEVERDNANYLHALAQSAAKKNDVARLRSFVDTLTRRPMHSGVRIQTQKMMRRAMSVWRKHSDKPWPSIRPDDLPFFSSYKSNARK